MTFSLQMFHTDKRLYMMVMGNICIALFFIRNKRTVLIAHSMIHTTSDDNDDDNDDDVHFRVRSGQGKLEKSGKIKKRFPVTRKSGNIDYSPIVRESQGI